MSQGDQKTGELSPILPQLSNEPAKLLKMKICYLNHLEDTELTSLFQGTTTECRCDTSLLLDSILTR